jgi:uncharacterized YkwD family protein/spore coat assembly protein SafA
VFILKRKFIFLLTLLLGIFILSASPLRAAAQNLDTYTVKSGDTMWKISVWYEIGLSEIIEANPQVSNPHLIYPNQKLNIPLITKVKAIEHDVIELCNRERAKAGLPALRPDWQVSRVARHKSQDMRDKGYFSHTSPTYGSPFNMLKAYDVTYRAAGENIAQGQPAASDVVRAWMNSEGHRKNILSRNYTHIGVGYVAGGSGRHYWTQMFIAR